MDDSIDVMLDDWYKKCMEEIDKSQKLMVSEVSDSRYIFLKGYEHGISMALTFFARQEKMFLDGRDKQKL